MPFQARQKIPINGAVLGAQLAVQEINQAGGVLDQKLELLLLDNNSTPIGSYMAAETAATAGVKAIIGSFWSSHSLAIAKVAEKHKIPMISPTSTIPSLTAIGDHIFRVCYDDNFQGKMIAEFAFNEHRRKKSVGFCRHSQRFQPQYHRNFQPDLSVTWRQNSAGN